MEKVVGYVRVSTSTQVQFGFGLDTQKINIKKYCEMSNLELVEIFEDKGISGTTTNRDGLSDLINFIEMNDIKKIVVFNTSRLWRETTTQAIISKDLKKIGADIVSIENPKFSIYSEGTDKLLNTIMTALDDYERYQITKKLSSGRRTKANKGTKACGVAPMGYRWDNANIVIDTDKAQIVKEIYSLYNNGASLQKIADTLNNKGIATDRGKNFSKQAISVILKNDFYVGTITHGDIKKQGNHEPIISKVLFGRIQSKMNKNRKH